MEKRIWILVATMSGTAEMVADELADALAGEGWKVNVLAMDRVQANDLANMPLCLICTSTYGTGEVPDNGKAFYAQLLAGGLALDGLRYGVVSLGDSTYAQTFCFGGKRFDDALSACGAVRIGERFKHDRRSADYPEEAAREWLKGWLEGVAQALAVEKPE